MKSTILSEAFTRFKEVVFKSEVELPKRRESAWSEDMNMYASKDFTKYNPDDLIGKKGYGIYKKMMQDEQVKAAVKFKRDAITSREYDFIFSEEAQEELSEEEQKQRRSVFNHIINSMVGSFSDKLNGIISGMYYGFSITEKLYTLVEYEGKSWVGIDKLKLRPFNTFEFQVDEYGNIKKFVQKINGSEQELDLDDFIHYIHNPEIDDHYGQSDLREAYRAWFSKDVIIKYQNIFLGRYAAGFVWATIDNYDETTPEFLALQRVLTNIQTKTAIIVPEGVEINVESPSTTDAYEKAVAQQDKAISKALLVPNLIGITEQGDVGSYSQSETQLEAFLWTLDADATRLAEVVNEQLFRDLGDKNWGDGLYPEFKLKPLSETMKLRIIKMWSELVGKKSVTPTLEDENHIRGMMKFPSITEEDRDGKETTEDEDTDIIDPDDNSDSSDDEDSEILPDETILGESILKTSKKKKVKLTKAMKRVDFAAIDRNADVITFKQTDSLADVVAEGVRQTLDKVSVESDTKDVAKIRLPAETVKNIKTQVSVALKDGWALGQEHARLEINRAQREAKRKFAKINFQSIQENAAKYFETQSFIIAGDISDKVVSVIKAAIMRGIQYEKSPEEVIEDIYQQLSSKGFMSKEAAVSVLGDELRAEVPDHALNTIIRTYSFGAVNEARYQYFQDPDLEGFVEALEYSAILDSRVTEICDELGTLPHVHSIRWSGWNKYRPLNHYNCRSLLIPVTIVDDWVESPEPVNQPQEGFG